MCRLNNLKYMLLKCLDSITELSYNAWGLTGIIIINMLLSITQPVQMTITQQVTNINPHYYSVNLSNAIDNHTKTLQYKYHYWTQYYEIDKYVYGNNFHQKAVYEKKKIKSQPS